MRNSHEMLLHDILHEAWNKENPKWAGSTFEVAKRLSTTGKGNAIEDFALQLLQREGYAGAERHHARRGDWDLRVGKTTIEVKCATIDTGGNFQFNGIRYDTKYTHLLVIGIAPEAVVFNIYRKKQLHDMTLVSMRKGANSDFKLTRAQKDLRPIADFGKAFGDLNT